MSHRKKVFISGKLPKKPTPESKAPFVTLGLELKLQNGNNVTFPTVYSEPEADWDSSIRSDISALMSCEELHLLHSWQGHKRSEILRNIAIAIGIKVYYH